MIMDSQSARCQGDICFNGKSLSASSKELHLGNLIGHNINVDKISAATADFNRRVNLLWSRFKYISVDVKYHLFKTNCMSLYGCQLWDLPSKECDVFYVAWRKAIRCLLGIDNRTHCNLLHLLCNDLPVDIQIHKRFLKFFHSAINNPNIYTSTCARLAMFGSRSATANSLNHVTNIYCLSKFNICHMSLRKITKVLDNFCKYNASDLRSAGIIRDFLQLRDNPLTSKLDKISIQYIVNQICTE